MDTPAAPAPATAADTEIVIRVDGRAGRITLNRPQALNALTYAQVLAIGAALEQWRTDDRIRLVILDGAGEKAFCAGGDIIAMYDSARQGPEFADRFWRDEYRLNATLASYPKPVVALMHGFVMGGGIGLAGHASHRIVTETSQLAMPETTIGLIPDVGGTWLLAAAPGRLGAYLGLLGERMGPADALYAGFADTFVPQALLPALIDALTEPDGEPVGVSISRHAAAPPPPVHASRQDDIDRLFDHDAPSAIDRALAGSDVAWAAAARTALSRRSPLALALTLAALAEARGFRSLEQALDLEYRLTTRLFRHGEFIEGIRALLVDKDKAPRWQPPTLEAITPDMLAPFLAPLEPGREGPF